MVGCDDLEMDRTCYYGCHQPLKEPRYCHVERESSQRDHRKSCLTLKAPALTYLVSTWLKRAPKAGSASRCFDLPGYFKYLLPRILVTFGIFDLCGSSLRDEVCC